MRIGERSGFPLSMRMVRRTVDGRCVRIGNAAQQLHPVAAQGFNLGLRDVWDLFERLWDTPSDPGAAEHLESYAKQRAADRHTSVWLTHSMIGIFGSSNPIARASRGAALGALALFKPLRDSFARRMMFGSP